MSEHGPAPVTGERRLGGTPIAAAVLRLVLRFEGDQLGLILVLLAVWLTLVLAEAPLSRRWPPAFAVYMVLQAAVVLVLLGQSDGSDYFGILLAVPSMQAMQRRPVRWAEIMRDRRSSGVAQAEEGR